jgi:hypothetical protein
LATSRSASKAATGLDRMLVPRSACRVRQPGAMSLFGDGVGDQLLGELSGFPVGVTLPRFHVHQICG